MPMFTRFAAVIESGRSSRGKYTLVMSDECPTSVLAPIEIAVEKKNQGRKPVMNQAG